MASKERSIEAGGESIKGLDLGIVKNPSTGGEGPIPPGRGSEGLVIPAVKGSEVTTDDMLKEASVKIGPKGNFSRNSA